MAKISAREVLRKLLPVSLFLVVIAVMSLALFGVMLPPDWFVIRDTTVNAPPERIYPIFADFDAWEGWNPWQKADPKMKLKKSPKSSGKGAFQTWEAADSTGKTEILEAARNREVTFRTTIKGDWDADFNFRLELQPRQDGTTELRWVAFGREEKLLPKLFAQLLFDGFMGPDFEKGLASIKSLAEQQPKE